MGVGERIVLAVTALVLAAVPALAAKPEGKALADLPPAARMAVSEAMGRDDSAYHATREGDGYRLKNRKLTAQFDAGGASVNGWRLAVTGIGRGGELIALQPANPEMKANRIEYRRGDVTEWYVNGPLGLEQGFTLVRAPEAREGGTLALAIALPADMKAEIAKNGSDLSLSGKDGSFYLAYRRLAAWDAAGKALPARFELEKDGAQVKISVDDRAARYPIVVDPFIVLEQLTAADAAAGDGFGVSASLSSDGNTALIGAFGKNAGTGAAYAFTWSGTTWSEQQKLTASDAAADDKFGYSVALSSDGNTALIGANGKNSSAGAAYVFTRSGTTWSEQQILTAADSAAADNFGYSVTLSSDGNTALIGAYGKSSSAGAVYAFTRSGSTWSQQQKLSASDSAAADKFGASVSLGSDGNTALIGAYGKNSSAGAAYVFTLSGSTWSEQQKLTASDSATSGGFGVSVSLSGGGDTALIGAPITNLAAGAAYVFTRSGSTWSEQQKLTLADSIASDFFGYSLTLSSDGNTALIGAYGKNISAGAAYVFTRSGSTWSQQRKLAALDGATDDGFGYSVTMDGSGNTLLIGAFGKNSFKGAAYAFLSFGLCSAGNYYNGTACTPCAVGSYQTAGFNQSCIPAPAGTYVIAPGASSATPCAAGKYQSSTGQMVCLDCAPGKYQPMPGQTSCIDAPTGSFVSAPGSSSATLCLPGTYQSSTGQTSCISCPVGAYQNAAGQTSCITAPLGTHVIDAGGTSATLCAAGKYQNSTGQMECLLCAPGKYQPSPGQSLCMDAPAGFYVAAPGATSATPCDAGTYQSATGSTSCTSCPANTLQPATGQSSCVAIPKAATTIVTDPSTSPATLYAGIDTAGIYKSTDSGANWNPATTQPTNLRIKALVLKPGDGTKQFAATYGGGVFKSTDSGDTWSACSNTNLTNLNVVSLTINGSGKLYAGTEAGVFVSTDGCATWSAMNSGLP